MTEQEQARLIAALEFLKVPFDRKQISKLPATANRPALDYVNHAHVTNRLNQSAPPWTYTVDEQFSHGGEFWIRGTMTIYGVSRVEYGTGKNPLEAVSHFIRRAAMRFGVATDLWAKEEFEDVETSARPSKPAPPGGESSGSGRGASPAPAAPVPPEQLAAGGTEQAGGSDSTQASAYGEGAPSAEETQPPVAPTDAFLRTRYLTPEDQALLGVEWGSKPKALKAYRERFGERITRLADITYEMRDEMGAAR